MLTVAPSCHVTTKNRLTVGETNSGFGKSSLKQLTSFRVISSNQKLARELPSAPKAMARTISSRCLATSGTNTAGSVNSEAREV